MNFISMLRYMRPGEKWTCNSLNCKENKYFIMMNRDKADINLYEYGMVKTVYGLTKEMYLDTSWILMD